MSCEHHKTCGDCFSPQKVRQLELSARYLANSLAEATEWNLATLEDLMMLKSSSKSRIQRQKNIVSKMLGVLSVEYPHIDVSSYKIVRLNQILAVDASNIQAKFDKWLEKWSS